MAEDILARRYRRLLFAYPAEFRTRRGPELIGTLLDCAAPGQQVPRLREAADLVASGVRQRLNLAAIPGLHEGLVAAAPVALSLAAGLSAYVWWQAETSIIPAEFTTLGPFVYLGWLLAGLAATLPWRGLTRATTVVALTVTVAVIPAVAPLTTASRPPLWILMTLAGFGAVALTGTATAAGASSTTPVDDRLSVLAGAGAFVATAWAATQAWPTDVDGYYAPLITRVGTVTAATVLAVATTAAVRMARGTYGKDWLWAAVLLGLPASWLGPFYIPWLTPDSDIFPHFGRLAQVVLASCVAAATIRWLVHDRTSGTSAADPQALPRAGALALGYGAGLSLTVPIMVGRPSWQVTTTAILLMITGLAALITASPLRHWKLTLAAATATIPVTWLIAVYANNWTLRTWNDPTYTAMLAATTAFIPLTFNAVTAAGTIRNHQTATRRCRYAAAAVLTLSVGWLGLWTLPYLPSWGPALLVFAAIVSTPKLEQRT